MLSKCANPDCSEQFRYLHQGKIFHLTPTPELEVLSEDSYEFLYERFWLCDQCSKKMTLVWDGTQAKIVSLPTPLIPNSEVPGEPLQQYRPGKHAASAGRGKR